MLNPFDEIGIIAALRFGFKRRHFVINTLCKIENIICVLHAICGILHFSFKCICSHILLHYFSKSYFKLDNALSSVKLLFEKRFPMKKNGKNSKIILSCIFS